MLGSDLGHLDLPEARAAASGTQFLKSVSRSVLVSGVEC